MATQLILYPQNYNGYSFISNSSANQYVANGYFVSGISNNFHYQLSGSATASSREARQNSIENNSWKSYTSVGGTSSAVSTSASGVKLTSPSGSGAAGIYQLISNLTVGVCYELEVDITSIDEGYIDIGNGTYFGQPNERLGNLSQIISYSAGTYKIPFIPHNTREYLLLNYSATNSSIAVIESVSITECVTSPTTYTDLSDGQVICDLYEEETIPLSLSVDDFKNVAEKTQSYSKDFHLPNTKRNSKIFSHIFEVTRSTDAFSFNPYIKTRAILKEDSYTLFEGFLQLIDINDKEGEISYNVNLFSETITLADILKQRTFNNINFNELKHEYYAGNIENSWAGNLALDSALPTGSFAGSGSTTDVLKYPFVDWTGNLTLSTSGTTIELTALEDVFRPFINVKYLIDRIIAEAGFEYTSNFFDTTHFSKLFMDFNWGENSAPEESSNSYIGTFDDTSNPYFSHNTWTTLKINDWNIWGLNTGQPPSWDSTNNKLVSTHNNTKYVISPRIAIKNHSGGTVSVQTKWIKKDSSGAIVNTFNSVTFNITSGTIMNCCSFANFTVYLNVDETLEAQINPATASAIKQYRHTAPISQMKTTIFEITNNVVQGWLLSSARKDLNQWEFLKGIFTMFNLIVIKEEDILRIEPYGDIFVRPIHALNTTATAVKPVQHNWTDKVDISEINLKPLELVKKTKFTYEEDEDDYALGVYKKAVSGYLYGTKNFDASGFTALEGEEEIIATPFAPTIIRPVFSGYDDDFIIPTIYSGNEDGSEFEGFENAPRIMYDIQTVNLTIGKFLSPLQNHASSIFNYKMEFLQFGHLNEIPITNATKDLNFGSCQFIFSNSSTPTDNLYNIYYSPYYDELYNEDTRIMTMKVNLTPADIQNFKFYDTVVIKNREYRVNKIEYKPNTLAKVEFILIP